MTKRIDIKIEVEEKENIEQIAKIIEVALKTANVSYISPVLVQEHKRTEAELIRAENKVESITDELETLRRTTTIIADKTNI